MSVGGTTHAQSIEGESSVSELILASHCSATRRLLATDHVILIHGQVTWTTPELAPFPPRREQQRTGIPEELWFQQDGATCHTARATIDLLKDTFGDRLFSRFGPVNWPSRSFDLTPLDYFLWGYVKSLLYADNPQTLDHLEDNIRRVIADIRPQMLEKVIENWTSRLDYIRASRGSPMPEIIFKM
ncbi:putative DD41D transposase [Trichonephila clavipes]|nr:putative DD41D transposase [Trichonephila clavipes]